MTDCISYIHPGMPSPSGRRTQGEALPVRMMRSRGGCNLQNRRVVSGILSLYLSYLSCSTPLEYWDSRALTVEQCWYTSQSNANAMQRGQQALLSGLGRPGWATTGFDPCEGGLGWQGAAGVPESPAHSLLIPCNKCEQLLTALLLLQGDLRHLPIE